MLLKIIKNRNISLSHYFDIACKKSSATRALSKTFLLCVRKIYVGLHEFIRTSVSTSKTQGIHGRSHVFLGEGKIFRVDDGSQKK
jgi:hypothetical protein